MSFKSIPFDSLPYLTWRKKRKNWGRKACILSWMLKREQDKTDLHFLTFIDLFSILGIEIISSDEVYLWCRWKFAR